MRIQPGDRVALVAPAGPAPGEHLAVAVGMVESWGLRPVTYPSATAAHTRAHYLSGDDRVRADDVQQAWCDPDIAGIFCIRGGYGAVRILDLLDRDAMAAAEPKPLYGSSDVTALHEWMREQLGVPTWFTPMLSIPSLVTDQVSLDALRTAVLDPDSVRAWTSDHAVTLVEGRAEGRLIGGNLSLLSMTTGARGRPRLDNTGCIALLEDFTESTYRIDGYLHTLLRSGWFDGVTGVALGSWARCSPVDEIHALCVELLGPLGIPVVGELGFGHGPGAQSIPLGVPGVLLAGDSPALQLVPRDPTSHSLTSSGRLSP
ncbi:S66 peptidase family protein [Aeromicrobium ginsengisoli]|uniref:LD-carboxypeptidase n=1 Tax=Aeromicrobium ginsengisoli TaxID=363867 RepID=A0A5M4FC80_9ACTN|nr:LD-carboxypeptidase [Aeromicrobium ginsengisoli]KAA1395867.1 LD-carboxypeptidase [Aeromicrobium ginsengisoli]